MNQPVRVHGVRIPVPGINDLHVTNLRLEECTLKPFMWPLPKGQQMMYCTVCGGMYLDADDIPAAEKP